jgi:hypothetical protein
MLRHCSAVLHSTLSCRYYIRKAAKAIPRSCAQSSGQTSRAGIYANRTEVYTNTTNSHPVKTPQDHTTTPSSITFHNITAQTQAKPSQAYQTKTQPNPPEKRKKRMHSPGPTPSIENYSNLLALSSRPLPDRISHFTISTYSNPVEPPIFTLPQHPVSLFSPPKNRDWRGCPSSPNSDWRTCPSCHLTKICLLLGRCLQTNRRVTVVTTTPTDHSTLPLPKHPAETFGTGDWWRWCPKCRGNRVCLVVGRCLRRGERVRIDGAGRLWR